MASKRKRNGSDTNENGNEENGSAKRSQINGSIESGNNFLHLFFYT